MPHRILLVDDEALICRVIKRLLKHEGFEVRDVSDSSEVEAVFLAEGPFDLLLTDMRLPDISGVDLAKKLIVHQPGLKVVFMSGDVPPEFAASCLAIEKPFDKDDLLMVLIQALSRVP